MPSEPAVLRRTQDAAIREIVALQDAHGLPIVTDGEFRRLHFMESFGEVLGFEGWTRGMTRMLETLAAQTGQERSEHRGLDPNALNRHPATQRLQLVHNRPLDEYVFTQPLTASPVKVTLVGPDRVVQGFDIDSSRATYQSVDEFTADVVRVEREIVSGLAGAGCRYVQIDAPSYTAYVDARSLAAMRAQGEDPDTSLARAIEIDNALIQGFPGVVFGLHMCRGNRQSMWHREGRYDSIAERLFGGLKHHRLLLEYDTDRAGGFEPLRFVPRGTIVVLGLITTKAGRVETVDELKRRIDDATRYLSLEQLAISPQCGFASVIAGNLLTPDDQWRKLDVMLETALRVWGRR
jgi:5-methyltetrahydropteroyltriglutamate--homocysteine methyltransferase